MSIPKSPSPRRPRATMSDAAAAELLESAQWAAGALRGEPVTGGRAWRHVPARAGQPAHLVEVPIAEVASRVHNAAAGGALAEPDAAAIRQRVGLSQTEFAAALDVPVSTLRNWEQGRRAPRGPARQLLRVAAVAPEVLELLRTAS